MLLLVGWYAGLQSVDAGKLDSEAVGSWIEESAEND
jgi:hypothetical protein